MPDLTLEQRLEAIERRTNAAIDGPWRTNGRYDGRELGCSIIAARTDCGPLPGNPTRGQVAFATAVLNTEARQCEANAAFIAAARTDVPWLIEQVQAKDSALAAKSARIAELEKALEPFAGAAEKGWDDIADDRELVIILRGDRAWKDCTLADLRRARAARGGG